MLFTFSTIIGEKSYRARINTAEILIAYEEPTPEGNTVLFINLKNEQEMFKDVPGKNGKNPTKAKVKTPYVFQVTNADDIEKFFALKTN